MIEHSEIIDREVLYILMSSNMGFKLVDVRKTQDYEQEHIKGAISLPLEEIEEKAFNMFDKNDLIVVYCASFASQASTQAAGALQKLGFKSVLDYKGGIKDYAQANLPLEGSVHEIISEATSGGYEC